MGAAHATSEGPVEEASKAAPAAAPVAPQAGLTPATVMLLQRSAGNRVVSSLVSRSAAAAPRTPAPPAAVEAPATAPPAKLSRAPRVLARGFWGKLWGGIKKAASAVAGGVKTAATAVASGVKTVATTVASGVKTAATAVAGVASDVWEGAKSVGAHVVDWVKTAGQKTWDALKWFGGKSWEVIKYIGTVAWEKLSHLGTLAWSFIVNLPVRLWRLVIDGWEGIVGTADFLWKGLRSAAGSAWDALVGTFKWLKEGFSGALGWLGKGLEGLAGWAVDFVQDPSLDKIWDGLLGTLSWLGQGAKGLGKWGLHGIVGAATWAWKGLKGLGAWLWEGVKGGGLWAGELLMHVAEAVGVMEALQLVWGFFFRLRTLTEKERKASESVHARGQIPYWKVRVDEGSWLIGIGQKLAKLFKTKTSPAAITTMHVVHAPGVMDLPMAVHELTHVAQYESVGSMYMPQALHGQGTTGYHYGNLGAARRAKKRYKDFNREQQASIAEDYYVVSTGRPAKHGGTKPTLQPFVDDMRKGEF